MKIYIDCTNGVSNDMILKALVGLGGKTLANIPRYEGHKTYKGIKGYIYALEVSSSIKDIANNIYLSIALAEAKVHEETLETVHFHEVGRQEAIENIINIASCIESLCITQVYCTDIHDGHGEIVCSHGTIPVPVPAVRAMMETCDYNFVADNIETEMVTPSGLGVLIGLGAEKCHNVPSGKMAVGKGTRDIGREGLKITIL